ncbi:MAG: TIGR01458 family HAD-type hydrolase [Rubricoccaceae bacterium]|nr:TIGR01458 family HAD-type hydrolase [Rubricoccaceae bacterium]
MPLDAIRGVLLDLDGTLYQDGALLPGAREAVARLRRRYAVRFVTNTTSKSRAAVVETLAGFGIEAAAGDVVSPPAVAGARLRAAGETAALFLPEPAQADFDGVRQDDEAPDWVVVGDLGEGWDFDTLNRAFRLLLGGARLLALGRTRYWRAPDGLRLDAGPFVAALEAATGQTAVTVGKPAPAFFHAACNALGLAPEAVAIVGDDAETDVRAAQAAGLRGVLVRTGKFREADLDGLPAPHRVVGSIADL